MNSQRANRNAINGASYAGAGNTAPAVLDVYEPHRKKMRVKYGYCGPYRLGIAVGESGKNLPPPKHYVKRAVNNYWLGVLVGQGREGNARSSRYKHTEVVFNGVVVPMMFIPHIAIIAD
jgi:hypothetical protein